jgi:hypothetical protein
VSRFGSTALICAKGVTVVEPPEMFERFALLKVALAA